MVATSSTAPWLDAVFQSTKSDFIRKLPKASNFDAAKAIEAEQMRTKTYCGLRRIDPLLQALKDFSGSSRFWFRQIKAF